LSNDDPEVFEHFVQWLYTDGYDFDDSIQTREDAKNENEDVQALEYSSPAITKTLRRGFSRTNFALM
jgi:hypothetical protein